MSSRIILDDTFPHGSPGGYQAGCHGARCPAVMSCRDVHVRYRGDWNFRKLVDAGLTPTEIIAQEAQKRAEDARKARQAPPGGVKRPDGRTAANGRQAGILLKADADAFRAAHAEGLTDTKIGERLNLTRQQVRDARRTLQLLINPDIHSSQKRAQKKYQERYRNVTALHSEGFTDKEISERLNISCNNARYLRCKLNLPANRKTTVSELIVNLCNAGFTNDQIVARLGDKIAGEYGQQRQYVAKYRRRAKEAA